MEDTIMMRNNDLTSAWRNGRASDYSDRPALLLMSLFFKLLLAKKI